MRTVFLLMLITAVYPANARQKDSVQTPPIIGNAVLFLSSAPTGADVYVDSAYCGKTPITVSVRSGIHRLKAYYPSATLWNSFSATDTVTLQAGQEVQRMWEFGAIVGVNTVPPGARVLYRDEDLGRTPMYYRSKSVLTGELLFQKDGYEPATLNVSDISSATSLIRLKALHGGPNLPEDVFSPSNNVEPASQWATYVAGVTMIVSGVLAAYFKDQANRNFDDYTRAGNPASLSNTQQLDKQSAACFAVTQISFGVLAYKLLLE